MPKKGGREGERERGREREREPLLPPCRAIPAQQGLFCSAVAAKDGFSN